MKFTFGTSGYTSKPSPSSKLLSKKVSCKESKGDNNKIKKKKKTDAGNIFLINGRERVKESGDYE